MNKSLVALCVTSLLLTACGGEEGGVMLPPPPVTPDQPAAPGEGPDGVIMPTPDDSTGEGEGPDPIPLPTIQRGSLSAASRPVLGEVDCAGQALDEFGQFSYRPGETITCHFG
ncbi:MAG: hypothetical protein ACRCWL_15840, partial [Aeromonas sp.]